MKENIIELKISMKNHLFMNMFQALTHLPENVNNYFFSKILLTKKVFQSPTITIFHKKTYLATTISQLIEFDHVDMIASLQVLHFFA